MPNKAYAKKKCNYKSKVNQFFGYIFYILFYTTLDYKNIKLYFLNYEIIKFYYKL